MHKILLQVAMHDDPDLHECALRGLAVIMAPPANSVFEPKVGIDLVALAVVVLSSLPTVAYSDAAIEDALLLLQQATSDPQCHRFAVLGGGLLALSGMIKSDAPPKRLAKASAILVNLASSPAFPKHSDAVGALLVVLRLPCAKPSHAATLSALSVLIESWPRFDDELRRPEALQTLIERIESFGAGGAARAARTLRVVHLCRAVV